MSLPLNEQAPSPPPLLVVGGDPAAPSGSEQSDALVLEFTDGQSEPLLSTREMLLGSTALGYYLSLLMHVLCYALAAVVFFYFGNRFFEDDVRVINVRARLSDEDVFDDQPFEILPDDVKIAPEVPSKLQQAASNLQAVENGLLDVMKTDELPSLGGVDSEADTTGPSGFLFKLPEAGLAVTKGSFTAWTSPEFPKPRQDYQIIIEVRLPDEVKKYRLSDLSGKVVGTDRFERRIPHDRQRRFASTSFYTDENNKLKVITGRDLITVRENKIQLVVTIPGGESEIRDVITISSRRLREKQELELVFGQKK